MNKELDELQKIKQHMNSLDENLNIFMNSESTLTPEQTKSAFILVVYALEGTLRATKDIVENYEDSLELLAVIEKETNDNVTKDLITTYLNS